MIDTTRIKDIREDNDITQEQMASIMHVNRSTYSMWEIGLSVMSVEQLCNFAAYSGVCHLTFYIKCIKVLFLGLFLLHYIKFYFIIIVGR